MEIHSQSKHKYRNVFGNSNIHKGMFQAKLMDNTQQEIFIDNGATPSILPLSIYHKYPILQKYPRTESHTPIHTGGGMMDSHFWIGIPLKLDNQVIQIKTLLCDSECPYDIILGCTSLAQLSAWQDYASRHYLYNKFKYQ